MYDLKTELKLLKHTFSHGMTNFLRTGVASPASVGANSVAVVAKIVQCVVPHRGVGGDSLNTQIILPHCFYTMIVVVVVCVWRPPP